MTLWIGLAELRANPNCKNFRRFGEGKGAFVWVAAWEESPSGIQAKVKVMSEGLDCILYGLEKVEPLDEKIERGECDERFVTMRTTATRQPQDTVFGTFHTWDQEDRI